VTESEAVKKIDAKGIGLAGHFPYRSGIHPGMYTVKPWTVRQYSGFGNPDEANQRFRDLLEAGATGLSVAFDLPTQMGLDPDNPLSYGEVGRVGVSICRLNDMRKLFDSIPLDQISTSMTINATAPILLLMYQIVAEERGNELINLRGTVQNDILKEFIARGTHIFPEEFSLRLTCNLFNHCLEVLPNWNPISISGYHMEEAGASNIQEIAFTFANAIEYIKKLQDYGLSIDEVAPHFSFFFSAKVALIQETAKFRAAREAWARIVHERFGSSSEKSHKLRFHTQTAGSELFATIPELNLTRVTIQAIAAVLGGTQSLHANSFDEAIGLPSQFSSELAALTQKIISLESDLAEFVDPFAGSYVVESLTSEYVDKILSLISEIDAMGGALSAIKIGYQKQEIHKNAYALSAKIEQKEKKFAHTGFSQKRNSDFAQDHNKWTWTPPNLDELAAYKKSRDARQIASRLTGIEYAVKSNLDLMEPIKNALISGATLGEIVDSMKVGIGK
jgi:methylmalonyl-CoA mutase N-terminal domain/subunit